MQTTKIMDKELQNIINLIENNRAKGFETTLSKSSSEISKIISFNTEVMNKSYYEYSGNLSKAEYIKNFNWKHTWLLRNINELFEYVATILVCIFFTLMIIKKNSIIQFKEKKIIYILYILLILSLVISLKTPVIRMFHHIFLIIGIIFLFYRFRNYEVSIKKYYFITFFVLFLSFNFSKNFLRIYQSNFINTTAEATLEQVFIGNLDMLSPQTWETDVNWSLRGSEFNLSLLSNDLDLCKAKGVKIDEKIK